MDSKFNETQLNESAMPDEGSLYQVYNIEMYRLGLSIVNWCVLVVVLLAVFGNTLIVVVMSLPHNRKSPTSLFFTALAISDFLLILVLPFERWLHWISGKSIYSVNHSIMIIKVILNYSVPQIASWILTCITIERVLSVTIPHKIKSICTMKRSRAVLVSLILFIFAVYIFAFNVLVKVTYSDLLGPLWEDKVPGGVQLIQWWDLIMTMLVPFGVILIGSSVIITQLTRGSLQKRGKHNERNNSVTAKLLAANAVFMVTMSPFCVYFNFGLSFSQTPETIFHVASVLLLLSDSNAAWNFFVYCLSGTRFRSDVKNILCCKCK